MKEKIVGFKKGDSNVDKFKMMEFKKGGGRKMTVEYKCNDKVNDKIKIVK